LALLFAGADQPIRIGFPLPIEPEEFDSSLAAIDENHVEWIAVRLGSGSIAVPPWEPWERIIVQLDKWGELLRCPVSQPFEPLRMSRALC
jgi:hypothetical protein